MAPEMVGRYAIYQEMASGGMGSVHYGRFLGPAGFARTVAIKRLHPQLAKEAEFVTMLADEARLASRIHHPNVVQTLDVVENEKGLFVVMEYVHGESLSRLLKAAAGTAPAPIVVAIMIGALRGLHAAHEARGESGEPLGIIHRDVSPQNILVGADGQARVLDFGVAKATVRLTTTREGQLKGKLAYMSPEQLQGEVVDRRSDIYAASVVLWEALAGVRLFEGASEGALLKKILAGVTRGPSFANRSGKTLDTRAMAVIEQLDSVVLRGLRQDPSERFATAREMAVALESTTKVASMEAVEEWVSATAEVVLARRSQAVLAIETQPEPSSRLSAVPAVAPCPEPPDDATHTQEEVRSALSEDPRMESSVQPALHHPTSWMAFALAAAVPIILASAYALWPRAPSAPSRPAAAAPSPASSSAGENPPAPSSEPARKEDAPPVDVPSAAGAAGSAAAFSSRTAAPGAPVAPPTPTKTTTPRSGASPRPASRPARDCDPPYTVDSQGVRIPKAECF